jgi:predicted GIY-YIG superfamily endonuclease
MRREYRFYVYMMQSASRRTLYIGMTNDLYRRVYQHKTHEFRGFTYDYDAVRLVYWESFDDVRTAINREKQFKNWRRDKKEWLILRVNPEWKDLSADWYQKPPSTTALDPIPTLSSRAKRSEVEGPCVSAALIASKKKAS